MSNTERFRPEGLDQYVGQEELKHKLSVYIKACNQEEQERPLPHVLLAGPAGYGKTSLAHLIAKELDEPMISLDLSSMNQMQFVSAIRRFEGGILMLDEIHRSSKPQLEMLLTLMDQGFVPTPSGGRVECSWLTVIGATTEPEKLPLPVQQRFTIHPEFVDYSDDEAAQIVSQMAWKAGVEMPSEMAKTLGHACVGTPRIARDLVMAYEALSCSGVPSVEEVLSLAGVDSEGLGSKHLHYLRALEQMDGLAGERALMAVLQTSSGALRDTERVLLKRRLITLSSRGRCLTALGDVKVRGERVGHRRGAA
jgi:Holliday junction DNA helicase RuvB